jgi:DNA-binding FadR family transcriptional regulator
LRGVLPEHRAIFKALRQQNPDASEEAMRIHIRRSVERLKKDAESEGVLDMRASKDEKK